jgi:hypothetical protein
VLGWPEVQFELSNLVRDAILNRRADDSVLDAIERLPERHLREPIPAGAPS